MTNLPTFLTTFLIKCETVNEAQAIRRGIAEYTSCSYTSGSTVTYQSDNAATVSLVELMLKTHWPRLKQEAVPKSKQENRISPAQIGVMPTTPACKGKILMPESERENRITIETQSLEDSHAVANTIGHLITSIMIGEKAISFKLHRNVGYMDVAKLLATRGPRVVVGVGGIKEMLGIMETHMRKRGYLPCHDEPLAPIGSVPSSIDLATQMAWLEGFSVISECTGEQYCKILNPKRSPNLKVGVEYDPIGRAAIRQRLIEKYHVDVYWKSGGQAVCRIHDWSGLLGGTSTSTEEFGGCLGSAIVQCILNSK